MNKILVLNPWRFKENEVVELYWLGAPYKNSNGQWDIRVLFKDQAGQFHEESYPWGTLPALRIGQRYADGIAVSEATGTKGTLIFPRDVRFGICTSFKIPHSIYAFAKCREYGNQNICCFSIKNKAYTIPCFEIAKILAPFASFLNRILEPEGLDFLCETQEGIQPKVHFSDEVPKALLNENTIAYLSWLIFSPKARDAWYSVFANFYKAAANCRSGLETGFSNGIPIKVIPPVNPGEIWHYRGLENKNEVLILEILERRNIDHPCLNFEYSSPKLAHIEKDDEPRKSLENSPSNGNIPFISPDKTDNPANKSAEPIRVGSEMVYHFKQMPKMNKIQGRAHNQHTGEKIPQESDEQNEIIQNQAETAGTLRSWARGGNIQAIEFLPLKELPETTPPGLEEFMKAISHIRGCHKDWNISLSFISLSKKRRGSNEDKICAVVRVDGKDIGIRYLFEISRLNDWKASTLVIKPGPNMGDHGALIMNNLAALIDNNFHWRVAFLEDLKAQEGLRFHLFLHKIKNIENWGRRLWEKC